MNDNNCVFHEGYEKRLSENEKNIDEIYDEINNIKTKTALDSQKFTMILENLSKLPEAMVDIKDSLLLMKDEIKTSGEKTASLEKKLDILDEKVCQIDEEGRFNIRIWLKDNFIQVVCAVTGIVGIGTWISTLK